MEAPENKNELIEIFRSGPAELEHSLAGISEDELDYVPAAGGWNVRQIVHHLADGDDLWKIAIKMALGNTDPEFNLLWYAAMPQTSWADCWHYESRSIEISLELLSASRKNILQLLESDPDAWNKTVIFRKPDGGTETVPVGVVIRIQGEHVMHHIKRITEIRLEYQAK